MKYILSILAAASFMMSATVASARDNITWSVGISGGAPAPIYVAPPVVYSAPPPVVVYKYPRPEFYRSTVYVGGYPHSYYQHSNGRGHGPNHFKHGHPHDWRR